MSNLSASACSELLERLATDLNVAGYQSGPLWFRQEGRPEVVVEPLAEGSALAFHTALGLAPRGGNPGEPQLADLLAANAPDRCGDEGVYAIDATDGSLVLFRRIENESQLAGEQLWAHAQRFARSASEAGDAMRNLAMRPVHSMANVADGHYDESFRNLWAEFAFMQGLERGMLDLPKEGAYLLSLDSRVCVFVQPEAAGAQLLLKAALAYLPLDDQEPDAVFRALLEIHLTGEATDGVCFAIDEDADEMFAWRRLVLDGLDARELNEAIDSLAHVVEQYAGMLKLDLPTINATPRHQTPAAFVIQFPDSTARSSAQSGFRTVAAL